MPEQNRHIPDADATRLSVVAAGVFGRDADLMELDTLVSRRRVVCVSGPPGCGKSRLAVAFARQVREPVLQCACAGVQSLDGVVETVLEAMGAPPRPQESAAEASQRLEGLLERTDPVLMVLDDADSVDGLDAWVRGVGGSGTAATILVTRRTRMTGIENYPLKGLSVAAARELFIERARSVRGDFAPDEVSAIDQLVELLDGLPLAVELAAARVRVIGPPELLRRVQQRSDILRQRGASDPRHESLRSALDGSWEGLNDELRALLAGTSVFPDWFDFTTAERVVAPHVDVDMLDGMDELLAASLVESAYIGDSMKFRLLRTVQEYARERLGEYPWHGAVKSAFEDDVIFRAESLCQGLVGPRGFECFAQLDDMADELVDLIASWEAAGDLPRLARALVALRHQVVLRGPLERTRTAMERVVFDPSTPPDVRGMVGASLAEALVLRGEGPAATDVVDAAQRGLVRDEHPHVWFAVQRVSTMVTASGGPAALCATLMELAGVARSCGQTFMQARLLERLGFARTQANDMDGGWLAFRDARDLFRATGGELFASGCATGLGYVELRMGRLDDALQRFEEAVRAQEALRGTFFAASAHFNLGVAFHARGRLGDADRELRAALDAWRKGGFRRYEAPGALRLALVEVEQSPSEAAWSKLSEAGRIAEECRDHHNAAIAYVERAALDFALDRPVDFERVEALVPGIAAGADPDAFGSALALLAALAPQHGRSSLAYVNRLEESSAMFSESDPLLRSVLNGLRDIARAWHNLAGAKALSGAARAQQVARAWEWGGRFVAENAELPASPFVRLWARRLKRYGAAFEGFAPAHETFRNVLTMHRHGDWFQLAGQPPNDLSTRRPLRLLMRRLAELAEESRELGLDVEGLAAAGWPGEELTLSTKRNRVYTAVRFLREMDLDGVLITDDAGYRIAPDIAVKVTEAALPVGDA